MKSTFIIILKKLKYYDIPLFIIWNTALIYLLFFYSSDAPPSIRIIGLDKIVHIILFTILSIISYWIFTRKIEFHLWIYLYPITFAISSEIIQHYFISGRSGDFLDIIADFAGIIMGIKIAHLINKMLR